MTMLNSHVIMSNAKYFSVDAPINPYYNVGDQLDVAGAVREHTTIRDMMQRAGITVTQVDAPSDSQDGVYTANWALVRGKKAVLSRLPAVRQAEEAHAETVLQNLGIEVIHVPEGLRFSGQGDALPYGDYLFCGQGYRADEAAQAFAAEQLGFTRIQLQTVPEYDDSGHPVINSVSGWPDSFFYDIDLALAIIRPPTGDEKGIIAYCPEAFTPESQEILEQFDKAEKIKISLKEATEAFACNLVSTGETVIMSSNAPELANELTKRGLTVLSPEITELVKGGGYIRCTTLSLNEL